jgi:Helicase conserved C-terminal domain
MNSSSTTGKARGLVADYLLNEIWGPKLELPADALPLPEPSSDGVIHLPGDEQDVKYYDPTTKQLLIQGFRPEVLYGTGVLHSPKRDLEPEKGVDETEDLPLPEMDIPQIVVNNQLEDGADDIEEGFGLDQSQKLRPSAMGLTARVAFESGASVLVKFKGAIYKPVAVKFEGYGKFNWFRRVEVEAEASLSLDNLRENLNQLVTLSLVGDAGKYLSVLARARRTLDQANGHLTLTVVVKHLGSPSHRENVYQSRLKLEIAGNAEFTGDIISKESSDPELAEINYLYRHIRSFATGHGTAVEWDTDESTVPVRELRTVAVPSFYQEVLSFDAFDEPFKMDELAESNNDSLREKLSKITLAYGRWIDENRRTVESQKIQDEGAVRLLSKAQHILARMTSGLEALFDQNNVQMLEAFKLANQAMYLQQKNGKRARREWSELTKSNLALTFPPIQEPDADKYGKWRPFQIGFLLLSINGLLNEVHEDRDEVDLIFFPTGGGKTEAYLGAAAMTILYRRLTAQDEVLGVDVLMRYTLRLLTIQQFERSSGLITALEHLRRSNPEKLGLKPISIGVWLGSATTPNSRQEAVDLHKKGLKTKYEDSNPFVLSKCPWCAAAFGFDRSRNQWIGYSVLGSPKRLRFKCGDPGCDFFSDESPLPIWITDEDVYDEKPSFILATVDKFARMAWQPRARALFNLDEKGDRLGPPPSLVIQDELHLISGPLGSMVGLYEPVIEELCTDRRNGRVIKPKIIASTATTRKYESQIFALYGRPKVTLFPQAVSRVNETFFSKVDRDEKGVPTKGTLYLGVNPATYETGQTAAAVVSAALLQAPNLRDVQDKEMDYYRTTMWFFNSLRELGMTLTLMQSVVLDRIRGMSAFRRLPSGAKPRWPSNIMELTSRIASNKVASSLGDLALKSWEKGSVTTCLASSIMEVGVDVTRLGLLAIMSQPKSTAQYIQVSGRVGRAGAEGPGLVVMVYNSQRARDRSVYERFNTYHSKLYAQVEPVSVTPFSIPAMRHGLVGALLSHYRMTCAVDALPSSTDEQIFETSLQVIKTRLEKFETDGVKLGDLTAQAASFKSGWENYQPGRWGYTVEEEKGFIPDTPAPALMRVRRAPLPDYPNDRSIMVPASMRSVDGQTEIKVSHNPYSFITDGEEI